MLEVIFPKASTALITNWFLYIFPGVLSLTRDARIETDYWFAEGTGYVYLARHSA